MADLSRAQTQGGSRVGRAVVYGLLILVCLYYLVPLFVMVNTSLKTLEDIRGGDLLAWPRQITLEPWAKAWDSAWRFAIASSRNTTDAYRFGRSLENSASLHWSFPPKGEMRLPLTHYA